MEAQQASPSFANAVTCPLCRGLFNEPVTLACGHNYCYGCVLRYWNGSLRNVCCPQCKQLFDIVIPSPNEQLGNIASIIKQGQPQGGVPARTWIPCGLHKEPAKRFCANDYVPLCATCERSGEHSSHIVNSLEDAAQMCKLEIEVYMSVLGLLQNTIVDCYIDVLKEKRNLATFLDSLAETVNVDYRGLHDALKTAQIEQIDLAKEVEQEIEEETSNLLFRHKGVRMYIQKLGEKCEEPVPLFLQHIRQIISRCKEAALEAPVPDPPELKEKLWELSFRNINIKNAVERCRASLLLNTVVTKENITLDPFVAHPWLKLPAERKMVMYNSSCYSSLYNAQGIDNSLCVLGTKGFASGRRCWEVELTSEGEGWALGVAKESVQRTRQGSIGLYGEIWVLQPEDSPLLSHKAGTFCIRVYLDYEGGSLKFFHAPDRELIHTIDYIPFVGERVFPFFKLGSVTSVMKLLF